MVFVHFDYDTPAPLTVKMSGLHIGDPLIFNLRENRAEGNLVPMEIDPQNPEGPPIEVPGTRQHFQLNLSLSDLTTIMDIIFASPDAAKLFQLAGHLVVDPAGEIGGKV